MLDKLKEFIGYKQSDYEIGHPIENKSSIEDLSILKGLKFEIGTITSLSEHRSYLGHTGLSANFVLDINLSNMFPCQLSNISDKNMEMINPLYLQNFDTQAGIFYTTIGKLILPYPELGEFNKTDIHRCKVFFSIIEENINIYNIIQNGIEVERKSYQNIDVPNNISYALSENPIKIPIISNGIKYNISDILELNSIFESIKYIIKDSIANNFYQEVNFVRINNIINDFKNQISENSLKDIFVHIIDIIGEPEIIKNSSNSGISFYFPLHKNQICIQTNPLILDKRMNDVLYEISEAVNRIKDTFDKLEVSFDLGSNAICLHVYPDLKIKSPDLLMLSNSIGSMGGTSSYNNYRFTGYDD